MAKKKPAKKPTTKKKANTKRIIDTFKYPSYLDYDLSPPPVDGSKHGTESEHEFPESTSEPTLDAVDSALTDVENAYSELASLYTKIDDLKKELVQNIADLTETIKNLR